MVVAVLDRCNKNEVVAPVGVVCEGQVCDRYTWTVGGCRRVHVVVGCAWLRGKISEGGGESLRWINGGS